ncbi:tryptophan--tRNA ligase [candidate division WOR-3 bacterium]|uniref:Tryptophan--tRNA ligase n=1 Tax=candidate division WOR-3 bacterium TaxID=2052148 RepID=A0A9D5QCY9_UNCW3|nr:tryptophan--tRNA ligase [candidate division WOR-3 bacterium]MBD3364496.1 tryptophan--tRNA ligase [candidate division WOR-3 bacterium]
MIFSGIQPSGKLHIGNYLGAIKQFVPLQDTYDAIFGIVDLHAMTQLYDKEEMSERIINAAVNYLACGLDPDKATLMLQSGVSEHAELAWILSTVTPLPWIQRVPTFKEKAKNQPDNVNMGLFNYPVLMAADILLYKSVAVPVGEDQRPHLELTREIARAFNQRFGSFFPEPEEIIKGGKDARVMGLDGKRRMSKSLDNCIYLDDDAETIYEKVTRQGVTDPARVRKSDPGNPDICNMFTWHTFFSDERTQKECAQQCRDAEFGCMDCKAVLVRNIVQTLEPIQERQKELLEDLDKVRDIISEGTERARKIAREAMKEVREITGMTYLD